MGKLNWPCRGRRSEKRPRKIFNDDVAVDDVKVASMEHDIEKEWEACLVNFAMDHLLDVNVLVAWGWADHADHDRTARWLLFPCSVLSFVHA